MVDWVKNKYIDNALLIGIFLIIMYNLVIISYRWGIAPMFNYPELDKRCALYNDDFRKRFTNYMLGIYAEPANCTYFPQGNVCKCEIPFAEPYGCCFYFSQSVGYNFQLNYVCSCISYFSVP